MKRMLLLLLSLLCTAAWSAVNLNTATPSELQTLKGVGPAKARAIVEYRESHGPFQRIDELRNVPGFGEKTYKRLEKDLRVSGPSSSAADS